MKINKDKYIEQWNDELLDRYGVDAEYAYETYYSNIHPYIDVIAKYRISGDTEFLKEKYIREQLGVGLNTWKACKASFAYLRQALKAKTNRMKFKSEIDLQKLIHDNLSSKAVEMQLTLYNDEYKPKGKEVEINMPSTLDINIVDASVNEEELEE
jgi:hypothetical protein